MGILRKLFKGGNVPVILLVAASVLQWLSSWWDDGCKERKEKGFISVTLARISTLFFVIGLVMFLFQLKKSGDITMQDMGESFQSFGDKLQGMRQNMQGFSSKFNNTPMGQRMQSFGQNMKQNMQNFGQNIQQQMQAPQYMQAPMQQIQEMGQYVEPSAPPMQQQPMQFQPQQQPMQFQPQQQPMQFQPQQQPMQFQPQQQQMQFQPQQQPMQFEQSQPMQ